MNNVIVRNYKDDDLNAVNELLKNSFSIEKESFDDPVFFEIVVEANDKVRAYLLLTKVLNPIEKRHYFLVDYVCVSEEYRRQGFGKKLLDYAYMIAKRENGMYLQLTCSYFRIAAHHLYEACGYVKRESDIYRKEII